tara:strand:+ start:2419 stop:3285 length:867 start_codon:yes stop_codon:yes gene_type:complete
MEIRVEKVSVNWGDLPSGITWYFLGQPKTGKTTQAASWSSKGQNGVLLLDTDLGSDFVEGANVLTTTSLNPPRRKTMVDGKQVTKDGIPQTEMVPPNERGFFMRTGKNKGEPKSVYSLAEILNWLNKEWQKLPYDTIAIDTIDEVNRWIEEAVTKELGISSMGEGQWGADWGKARRKNLDIVKRLQSFVKKNGANLVLISHSKQTTMTDKKVQLMPELPRGLAYGLSAKADVIGYVTMTKGETQPMVSFESYDERAVGSRLKPLSGKKVPFDYQAIYKEITSYKESSK